MFGLNFRSAPPPHGRNPFIYEGFQDFVIVFLNNLFHVCSLFLTCSKLFWFLPEVEFYDRFFCW